MDAGDAIVQLGLKMDALGQTILDAPPTTDNAAKFFVGAVELIRDLERLKAEGVAAISAVLNKQGGTTEGERVPSLVRSFEFAAKLRNALSDVVDPDGVNQVVGLMRAIVSQLDAIGAGRAALVALLDNSNAGVRASAGAYLVNLMPDRVLPILRNIEETERANSAHFTAHWAILGWEREGKHKANKSD
jgi:hypothetical protein